MTRSTISNLLTDWLCQHIDTHGPMSLAKYMQHALYHPELGYYQNGQAVFGREGDYITAPLMSPLFSQCVAERCLATLKRIPKSSVLELGAGTGQMALGILLELDRLDHLPEQYLILEPSAFLQHRQQETLTQLPEDISKRVQWIHSLPNDNSFRGIIVGNEVIDAMPVHGFRHFQNETEELHITHQNGVLEKIYRPCDNEHLLNAVNALPLDPNTCYESEINLWIKPWLKSLYACLNQGDVLFIDYGYLNKEFYHPDRAKGTLRCFYQHHRVDDYLTRPGEQDITADVNFTHLGDSASAVGFQVDRYQTQAAFLMKQHITERLATIPDQIDYQKAAQAVKQLMLPHECGERFKVMSLSK